MVSFINQFDNSTQTKNPSGKMLLGFITLQGITKQVNSTDWVG
jgi:hypothetical protein